MRKRLGKLIHQLYAVPIDRIEDAAEQQNGGDNRKIGEILIENELISREQMLEALSKQNGIPLATEEDLKNQDINLLSSFPIFLARKNSLIPLEEKEDTLIVITSNINSLSFISNQLFMIFQKSVTPLLTDDKTLTDLINASYSKLDTVDGGLDAEEFKEMNNEEDTSIPDLIDSNDDKPIIKFVNNTILKAVKEKASDIHFESFEDEVIVRFRKDGKLHQIHRVPKAAQSGLITRIKIMGALNISEKRLPQDGNIKLRIAGNDIDLRLSTLPSVHGESVVLRILDKASQRLSLDESGFTTRDLKVMRELINKKHGIFLVTGPTGSGKTTTLYSALTEINSPNVKIITEEDPVEYQLKGINQIQINSKIGLTFANGLRSILRQDPDIIMVGEIRDKETADIAINASLTGHLVFSTLHTNDAPTAFTRLIDMGVEPFLISSTIIGVLAQRLVRRLCQECKEPYHPDDAILEELSLDPQEYRNHTFYRPKGCEKCNFDGFAGRVGIFELLRIDDDIRREIVSRATATEIRKVAAANGLLNLREDGALKAIKGITSPDEVLLKTQED